MEQWKAIEGFENYEVSNLGNVRNSKMKEIKKHISRNTGYARVGLYKSGKEYKKHVHRLVAYAFCDGYKEGMVVDHLNMDKSDNRAENLEWVSHYENCIRYRDNVDSYYGNDAKKVMRSDGVVYSSIHEAARKNDVTRKAIRMAANRKMNTANGYSWKLV